jgi:hypothetical protein
VLECSTDKDEKYNSLQILIELLNLRSQNDQPISYFNAKRILSLYASSATSVVGKANFLSRCASIAEICLCRSQANYKHFKECGDESHQERVASGERQSRKKVTVLWAAGSKSKHSKQRTPIQPAAAPSIRLSCLSGYFSSAGVTLNFTRR